MELAQDWRLFQKLTRGRKARAARFESASDLQEDITVVVSSRETPVILAVRSSREDFSSWIGKPLDSLRAQLGQMRTLHRVTESELEMAFLESVSGAGFFEQKTSLRDRLEGDRRNPKIPGSSEPVHFLIEALSSSWSRFFPRQYAIWIRLKDASPSGTPVRELPNDHLIFVKDGQVTGCGIPDLSSLGNERMWKPEAVVRHLSEKFLCPVQAVLVNAGEWEAWIDEERPWKKVREGLRSGRVELFPASRGVRLWLRWQELMRR